MKIPAKKYEVGRGRPPMHTRWKKGQSGNPSRVRKHTGKPVVQMIDEFFARQVEISEQGISRSATNFEAIILQLWTKAMAANKRAMKVLLKFQEFAAARGSMGGLEVIGERTEHLIPDDEGEENV